MSRSSTASVPKISTQLPTKSAWSKGPPQTSSAPSPRSQSPAPSAHPQPSHSRRPSTLGQGVPIKDGVSVPRNNVGAVKQGSAVTFGSIDDVSAPLSTSPAAAPPVKSEGVKTFGSVPNTQINGKASVASRPAAGQSAPVSSSTPSAPPSTPTLSATPSKVKMDMHKFFQNPSSQPSNSSTSTETSSPATRPSPLPSQTSSNQSSQQPPHSATQSQFAPFSPNSRSQQQNSGPGSGPPPRSTAYPRQLANGGGPRSQQGPSSGPSQMPAGMSSPRLAHPPPMPPPPPPMAAQMQPQIPAPGWPGYYYPGVEQHYMPAYPGWYPPPHQMPPPPQHQHPPHHPPSGPHTSGVPMSPRTHPPALQGGGPGTPTLSHATTTSVPIPPPSISHAPSSSIGSMSSPPPTPASALPAAGRLNANSNAFVPAAAPHKKITFKKEDGTEVKLESLSTKVSPPPPTPTVAFRQNPPGTPTRKTAPVRIETPEQRQKRLEEEEQKEKDAKAKADAEERAKKEKEEEGRRKKEEEERKRKEEEERKRKAEEEKERLRKEEEEKARLRKEEEEKERLRKEEEEKERLRKEEEKERLRKDNEERERRRKEEEKEEKERLRREAQQKEEEEQSRIAREKAREEEERVRKQQEEDEAKTQATPTEEVEVEDEAEEEDVEVNQGPEEGEIPATKEETKEKSREALRIDTALSLAKRRPGPLDLSRPPASPLASARPLGNLGSITYPEGISSPKPELNVGAKEGKFRYDREFLMQFMQVCKEKPDSLPPLDAIGLEPTDTHHPMARGGSGRGHRQPPGSTAPSRQASHGAGLPVVGARNQFQSMGSFTTTPSKFGPGERFEPGNRSVSMSGPQPFRGGHPVQRTASQGGPGPIPSHRTRSKRGDKRTDANKVSTTGSGPPAHGSAFGHPLAASAINIEHVAPLQFSENRWDRRAFANSNSDSPEVVDRKVKALLNKLTMEKFDSISDQIIQWANKSEDQTDGRTLIQVIRLVFEKATDEATWSEMYARLCRKMMEQISPKVQDEGIKNADGKPITGGQLFRKYLLNRCQEDFERGWVTKEATAAAAASKALEDEAIKAANEKSGEGEVALYSDEYYAAQKAKRQGLGLIKFIGELFKLQMLTERIMHECIKKLLGNVQNPEEEEIESLCKLMTTVGKLLDTTKAHAHMDVYFQRMKELTQSLNVTSRMQFMLQDVIELRGRNWLPRNAVAAPTTLAQVHEAAAKEKADKEKEAATQRLSMSRGGSRRGGTRDDYPQADGWTVTGSVSRANTRAGDLSQFGRISKAQQPPTTFGPSSVFAGKKDIKREPISRTASTSNMFLALQNQKEEVQQDMSKGTEQPAQRRKLVLQPRSKPLEDQSRPAEESVTPSEEEAPALPEMTEEAAEAKIAEDVKEFFSIKNLDEAEIYFTTLPPQHHHLLVNKLVSSAVESKEPDAQLVAELFTRAEAKELCSPDAFLEGLTPTAELVEDIAIDAPKAWSLFAIMVNGAELDEGRRTQLASKSTDSDKLLGLISS